MASQGRGAAASLGGDDADNSSLGTSDHAGGFKTSADAILSSENTRIHGQTEEFDGASPKGFNHVSRVCAGMHCRNQRGALASLNRAQPIPWGHGSCRKVHEE